MFERLDITIYELIRIALVAGGWLPDRTLYGPGDEGAFFAAIQVLKDAGHYIALHNIQRNIAKGERELNAVYILHRRRKEAASAIGQVSYVNQNQRQVTVPDSKWDITYEIRYVASSYAISITLQQLIANLFPIRKYFTLLDLSGQPTDEKVLIAYETDIEVNGTDRIEWAYQYTAFDILLGEEEDNGPVSLITNIELRGDVEDDIEYIS